MKISYAWLLALALAQPAHAVEYIASGKVEKIFSLDRVAFGANSDSALLSGLTSAGSCATNDGLVGLVLRDDEGGKRQLAVLLSAKLSGMSVTIRVDDAVKTNSGYCYLKYLELH